MNERQRMPSAMLEVLSHATTAIEPGDRPFYNPAFREHDTACDLISSCDDFEFEPRPDFGQGPVFHGALIGSIRAQLLQQRKAICERGEQHNASVPILNVSRMNNPRVPRAPEHPLTRGAFCLCSVCPCHSPANQSAAPCFRPLHTLAVDDAGRRTGRPILSLSTPHIQCHMNPPQRPIRLP